MAGSVSAAATQIKHQLHEWIGQSAVQRACAASGYRWRRRVLDPLATVHAMLIQMLAQVALSGLGHVCQLPVTAQAFCAARRRLPLSVWLSLLEESCRCGCEAASEQLWHGLRIMMADGLSVLASDTADNRRRWGKGANQHGGSCGYPLPKLLALVDFGSGLIRKIVTLPHACNEKTCLARLLRPLSKTDLLLCDSGLCSYGHLMLMMQRGTQCCIALPRWLCVLGRGKGTHRPLRKLGDNDLLVRWARPEKGPMWMSKTQWRQAPPQLLLRQVSVRIRRPGFRHQWLRVITTLLDPIQYPHEQIIELYRRRWRVETCFRDLKQTLRMRQLGGKSVQTVRKQIVCFVLLYNLVRRVMLRAARAQHSSADRVSFIDAARWLLWSPAGQQLPRLIINPRRTRPPEPRLVKHARRRYGSLRKSRASWRKDLLRCRIQPQQS